MNTSVVLRKVEIKSFLVFFFEINSNTILVDVIETEKMDISTDSHDNIDENITTTKSNKRKHSMTSSLSQRSISRPLAKKIKKNKSPQIKMTPIKRNYRLPIYLKVYPNLLFRSLRLQLKHNLNKKNERQFLHHRLQLLDQQCRVTLHQNLWHSYLALGCDQRVWPVSS